MNEIDKSVPMYNQSMSPRMYGVINGIYIPTSSVEVTQTAYGVADTSSVETYLVGQKVDYGELSQKVQPTPFRTLAGFVGTGGRTQFSPLLNGTLDEIDNQYDTDTITFHARGLLANLVDSRLSITPNMNDTAENVIRQIITSAGLTAQVAHDPLQRSAGSILRKDDIVTGMKNVRALDFIHSLCRWIGWTVRTVGGTIIVGPPPDPVNGPKIVKNWSKRAGMTLRVVHNALHNKNIKVRVVSYIQSHKARSRAVLTQDPVVSALFPGLPAGGGTVRGGTGHQSGFTSVGERTNVEEYVIPIPNATEAQCQALAQVIADEINRHEFVADFSFTPTLEEFALIVKNSPDFTVQLTGCDQKSNNGLYYPKQVSWSWKIGEQKPEFSVTLKMVNHPLPAPSGGLGNSTVSSV